MSLDLRVQRTGEGAMLPDYAYQGDAGLDLAVIEAVTIEPNESVDIRTGLKVQLPEGYWGRITGRSSTLRRRGLFVNEGVIDTGYRGELFIFVTNRNDFPEMVVPGDRLAQLILSPVVHADIVDTHFLEPSERGEKGFGSSGLNAPQHVPTKVGDIISSVAPRKPKVYLGGPIDFVQQDAHTWRHDKVWEGYDTYCPICMAKSWSDAKTIIDENFKAIDAADICVFMFGIDGSFGTPIEIWRTVENDRAGRTFIQHPTGAGLFLGFCADRGCTIVPTFASLITEVQRFAQGLVESHPI